MWRRSNDGFVRAIRAKLPTALWASLAGIAVAAPVAIYLWRFMVDDALISARYAAHLASGEGYRFNPGGPSTDGVTPLGWAYVLAPFAGDGAWAAYRAAKLIGLAGWLVAAAALGRAIARLRAPATWLQPGQPLGGLKWASLGLIAVSAPLGAWSVAGMETGVVLAMAAWATCAFADGRGRLAAAIAGVVAGLRPECFPWALCLAVVPLPERGEPLFEPPFNPRRASRVAIAALPFIVVAITRDAIFARPAPLSIYAKPASWALGGRYALACALLCGVLAVVAWQQLPRWIRGLQAVVVVHLLAIAVAGGDWMPLSRLIVVAMPAVVLVAAYVAGRGPRWIAAGRLALALVGPIFVLVQVGPRAAAVEPKRVAVIEQLKPVLSRARVIAAPDIGWVGVAAPRAQIVDLAGVTDPAVAALRGGHTSKRVPASLLSARDVDAIVLWLAPGAEPATPWYHSMMARNIDHHIASLAWVRSEFELRARSHGSISYLVVTRRRD